MAPKKSKGKKKYSKKSKKHGGVTIRTFPASFTPDEVRCKLVYTADGSMTTASGGLYSRIIRANSLYDPEYAVGGIQPLGFDQLATLYSYYEVMASKISWRIAQTGTGAGNISRYVILPMSSTQFTAGGPTSALNAQAWPNAVTKVSAANGQGVITVSKYATTRKIYGDMNYDSVENESAIGGNPALAAYLVLYAQPLDGTSTQSAVATIKVTYYCRFFTRLINNATPAAAAAPPPVMSTITRAMPASVYPLARK